MTGPGGLPPGWARLDWRTVLVRPVSTLVTLLPAVVGVVFLGSGSGSQVWFAVAGTVLLVAVGIIAYATTRFRVTDRQVELRSGLVVRRAHATPRDRVRTVEATAPPLHRLLGVVRVRIGTGTASGGDSELVLDAVSHAGLDALRAALLHRGAAVPETGTAPSDTELMRWQLAWARYAPLSTTGVVAVAAVFGGGVQTVDQLGVGRASVGSVERLVTGTDPLLLAALGVLALAALSVVLAVAISVEGWWGARLTRSPDAGLHVRRGLLTTRALTVEQARLRGTTTSEPLLVRAAGGARVEAVVSGLGSGAGSSAALTPAAPVAVVDGVTERVLGTRDAVHPALRPHPPAARRRRLVRTLVPLAVVLAALVVAVVAGGTPWWVPVVVAVVGLPGAVAMALDRAHSLGHTVTAEHLVVREGSLVRRTTALQRAGIIGVTLRRSVFQRRAGVATVFATTAAGPGAYELLDVGVGAGLVAMEEAVPGLLTPFLTRTPPQGSVPSPS